MTATATGAYATLAGLKARLDPAGTTTWGATAEATMTSLINQVNGWIESYTRRIICPDPASSYLLDGSDALESGRLMIFPRGIRALTKLEVATNTGASFSEIPAGDYFLRPDGADLDPGWPYMELWLTDIPSSANKTPSFYPGFDNVRLTGTFGWAAIPDEITDIALNLAVGKWRAKSSGSGDTFTIGADGERTFERMLSYQDRLTIDRYRYKPVLVIGD